MAFDAFISYTSKDKMAADAACAVLERAGVRCWIAPRDIRPGGEWGGAIIEAIDQCRVMVLIFSSSANDSRQVFREIERAVSKGVPVVPVRIEAVTPKKSLEYFLGAIHWLDALTPPLENHLEQLAEAVKALLQIDVAPGTAPSDDNKPQAVAAGAAARAATAVPRDRGISLGNARRWLIPGAGLALIALLIGGVWFYQSGAEPQNPAVGARPGETPSSTAQALNLTRSADSGIDSLIAYARAWDANCNAIPVEVSISKNPANGTVSIVRGATSTIPASTPAGGSTGPCAGKTVTGNEIRYKSKAGFRGTDSVSYHVTSGNRPQQLQVITINVK